MDLVDMYPLWSGDPYTEIKQAVAERGTKIVVLDDDPTGGQAVHDVDEVLSGELGALTTAFRKPEPVVFVLTNSRSMSSEKAIAVNRRVIRNLKRASEDTGRDFTIISRSDSTLRGHFPAETDAMQLELAQPIDGLLFIPFFQEGGAHYV